MRVLVMGGTQFNGLALVHELVRQGHEVSVCNRGRTESDIPDSVGRLVADRTDHEHRPALCLYGNNDGASRLNGKIIFSIPINVS